MRFFIFISAILSGHLLSAQLATPIKGGAYSTARKENFNGFIGENSTTLFSVDYLYISRKKQELIIRKFYKQDLKLVDSKNIYENPPDGFYGEPLEVFYKNDSLFLFSNLYDEAQKTLFITFGLFDINGTKLYSSIIDTLPDDESLQIHEEENQNGFVLIKSHKFSNLTEQEIAIKCLDPFGNITLNETAKSPMALQNINIEKIAFVKGGPIYVLCNYNFDPASASVNDEREMINNKYALWAYDPELHFLKEFELRMQAKWLNGIEMQLTPQNNLLLAGYFNESRYYTVSGVFSLIINADLAILSSKFEPFGKDVLAKFIEEKDREKTKELEDYKLNHIAVLDNSSYFLLGERFYKYIERNYDPRTNITTTTEHYNYNSIIVSYFDSLGNHIWTDRIPKYQNSTNDYGYFSSYTFLNTGSEVYLFFNDTDKNNDLALTDYFNYKGLFNNRRFQISAVQVDTAGVKARGPIVSVENQFILRAKESNQIAGETMYLMTEVGREAKIFSVNLKKKN